MKTRKNPAGRIRSFLLAGCSSLIAFSSWEMAAQEIFKEDFEQTGNISFNSLKIVSDSPGEGKYSANLVCPPNAQSGRISAGGKKMIAVEPDTWYKMKVRQRNDVKIGEVRFGLLESRRADKKQSSFYDWRWKAVPLNIMEWKEYVMEFKTAANTHGIQLWLQMENDSSGSSWWDSISIEKFNKVFDPVAFRPFHAAATFTDIPTKQAYFVTKGNPLNTHDRQRNTTYHWKTLDLPNEKLTLDYRNLPENSLILTTLFRGEKIYRRETGKVTGSGSLDFPLALNELPEGIYRFRAVLQTGGKEICSTEKEIWRIDSRKSRTPKHEVIRNSSTGPGRQRLVNGKPYHPIYSSAAPTWGLFSHHKEYCKPDLPTYINTMQEQFGQDTFSVWYWRGPRWDADRKGFVEEAVRQYRAYLDFLQEHNCYGRLNLQLVAYKKEPLNLEDIRGLVRGVKDHPALLEWHLDEPEVKKYTPEEMLKAVQVIRQEDPAHNILINLCDPEKFHLYAPTSDIASYDVYPFPGTSLLENRKRTAKLLKAFPNAPFDSYLQMFNFNTLEMPSFDQIRATFILDRINGSHSLISYAWAEHRKSFLTDPELQSYYRAIVSMFRRLENVLSMGKDRKMKLKSSTDYVMSRALDHQGKTVLLMVNISPDTPADVTVIHSGNEMEDFFDSAWKYKGDHGKFQFKLKPVETKVLRFNRK